jgi:cell division protein FtsB
MTQIVIASNTGWVVGFSIGLVVVLVVVALVVPILVLAHRIGNQAATINDGLAKAVTNTAALNQLNATNTAAETIVDGLRRGRAKLGG